jgi:DNA replication protein DnaC
MSVNTSDTASLGMLLGALRLPSFVECFEEKARRGEKEGWSYEHYLFHLSELELAERERRRTERLLTQSGLPREKTLNRLDLKRFPDKIRRQIPILCQGGFVDRAENILVFGLPGRGKTHIVSAVGHELVARGYRVLFVPTFKLVQQLLIAKRELCLEAELRKLDRFEAVILDDIGYIQQDRDEMEVLFTFLGERYERRSVLITSNLVFSKWDRIFKDSLTTAAAIDRVVHHSTILEVNLKRSYRAEEAQKRNQTPPEKKADERDNNDEK